MIKRRKIGYFMHSPSPLDWRKGLPEDDVTREVERMMLKNVPLRNPLPGQPPVLGFPVGELDDFAIATHASLLAANPNNIGIHTMSNKLAESGFEGSQEAERLFIGMVADVVGANLDTVDGYIESGGSTANMAGLCIGRNKTNTYDAKGNALKNCKNPTAVLCSHLTHYSVAQSTSHLGIGEKTRVGIGDGTGIHMLGTDTQGHVLLDQMEGTIRAIVERHKGISNIVVVGNAGTTMLGSVDDIPGMSAMIGRLKAEFPDKIFHMHVDAAHGGLLAPFLEHTPDIGFQNEHVDTITIDPHKMGKVPFGCGVVLARKKTFDWMMEPECVYVPGGSRTITGSRSGVTAVGAYASFRHRGKEGLEATARRLREITLEVRAALLKTDIQMFESDLNIIAFKTTVADDAMPKFILHNHEHMPVDMGNPHDANQCTVWNIVAMEHVREHINGFIDAYKQCTA